MDRDSPRIDRSAPLLRADMARRRTVVRRAATQAHGWRTEDVLALHAANLDTATRGRKGPPHRRTA